MFGKRETKEPRKVIPMDNRTADMEVGALVEEIEKNTNTEPQLSPIKQEQPEEQAEIRRDPFQKGITKERLQEIKVNIFNDLIDTVDLAGLNKLSEDAVREEISDIVSEIISMRDLVLSGQEQQHGLLNPPEQHKIKVNLFLSQKNPYMIAILKQEKTCFHYMKIIFAKPIYIMVRG